MTGIAGLGPGMTEPPIQANSRDARRAIPGIAGITGLGPGMPEPPIQANSRLVLRHIWHLLREVVLATNVRPPKDMRV